MKANKLKRKVSNMEIKALVESILENMTLKEKIYQTICHHSGIPEKTFYTENEEELKAYAEQHPYGSFFLGEEIIGGNAVKGANIAAAIKRYQKYAKYPALFCGDTEYGAGYMLENDDAGVFPYQMALGATRDTSLAYEYGKYTALDAAVTGINWSLAPVADINYNFINPVTNTRAFGDDAELVAEMADAVVRGMQDYGLAATAKHFPGDGTDYRDQHYVTTTNRMSVEEWKKTYGMVYKKLIDSGVMSIMAGHINFPAYQKERFDGVALPGSLSKELLTDLLKGEMGFEGVIVSDAVWMNGFLTFYQPTVVAEIESFKAGCDIILWPSAAYPEMLEKAINEGTVSMERLDDAVTRILTMKAKLGLLGNKVEFKTDSRDGSYIMDKRVAEAAVTLVKDRHNQLPKKDIKKVTIIGITTYDEDFDTLQTMKSQFEANGVAVDLFRHECPTTPCADSDLIIYATFIRQHHPRVFLDTEFSWQTATFAREKVCAVALGSPYMLSAHFETVPMAIAAYSDTKGCQRAVADAICGKIAFKGTLPVKLPN